MERQCRASQGNEPPDILVVDDEQWNRELIKAMLLPEEYRVHFAEDGEQAIKKAAEIELDAILLDLIMPKMDGFETARRLKKDECYGHIPIIVITGAIEEENRIRMLEIGVDDFLAKPINRSELLARLRTCLRIKAYQDRLLRHQEKLEDTVAERTRELKESFDNVKKASLETIHRLTLAAEYRDEDTGDHIQRMSRMAAAIAAQMKMPEEEIETLLYATPMHDIGKIAIPDRILTKPGKLDADEWRIMKQHTTFGGRILEGSSIGFIRLGEVVALTHHERWDGTGYPKGLAGTEIPLEGRIVAIADVFDALTTKRPYKEAFSVERSFSIIEDGKGAHFDPDVVDAFFSIKDEIVDIQQKYNMEGFSSLYELAGAT